MRARNPSLNEARREAILDAATECFVRRGFHASSMKDISTAAGMSPGTVYHYFASKADIVAGIIDRENEATAALLAALGAHKDVLAGLFAVVDRIAGQVTERDLVLHAEVASEVLRHAPLQERARRNDAATCEALAERLRLAQSAGQLPAEFDSRGAAIAIVAMIDGLLWRATLHGPGVIAAELPALRQAFARLLGKDEAR
jgi:AcrR family transcriptional regulator